MAFNFSGRELPTVLRVCRAVVWAQAVYTFFAGVFVVLTAQLLGGSLPFHDGTVSGGGAAMLGLVYVTAALLLGWLGVALARRRQWVRTGIVVVEVFLAVILVYRAFDLSVATAINVAFCAAILVLLFTPETQRVLEGTPQA
ncbi:MAG: hypothetical protein M3019_10670 [Candidatus Dormibacteraeota bacterium]|nr:hypothetical protein [Candidatus Dormibacteraeota bacterium]